MSLSVMSPSTSTIPTVPSILVVPVSEKLTKVMVERVAFSWWKGFVGKTLHEITDIYIGRQTLSTNHKVELCMRSGDKPFPPIAKFNQIRYIFS
jgi:hypothetical protein